MKIYATVVLAAGKGTRMRSTLPKVLHPLVGVPLLAHVLKAVEAIPSVLPRFIVGKSFSQLAPDTGVMERSHDKSGSYRSAFQIFAPMHRPIVVLGHDTQQVEAIFGERCFYALQEEQLGTGHAVLAAQGVVDALNPLPQTVLVCYGDTPLISSEALARVLVEHLTQQATVTFLTAVTEQPSDFGRVVRDMDGQVCEVVEMKRASEEQKRIKEINSGVYCFDRAWLWSRLQTLPRNATGEYYLTDLIGIAHSEGRDIATTSGSVEETLGVNNRVQLAAAEQLLRQRVLERHMLAGVTIIDPAATYIDENVIIGTDTVILPGTMITGKTRIGSDCCIGPGTTIDQSVIGDRCVVRNSALEEATVEDDVSIGPFSHCRPGAHLAHGVRMGNFAEVKNSYVGSETDMHHFSYLGDAIVGEHVNIGAGVVTVNYDGVRKHKTTIGEGAFVGCDTMLIAPVTVGEHAITGAGAVVNRDVPADVLVVGVPARIIRRKDVSLPPSETAESSTNARHTEPFASLEGKLREGSGSTDGEILRFAQDDSTEENKKE